MKVEFPGGYIVFREIIGIDRLKREILYDTLDLDPDASRLKRYEALYITNIIIQCVEAEGITIPDVNASKDTIYKWWNDLTGTPENAALFNDIKTAIDKLNYAPVDKDLAPPTEKK